MTSEPDLEALRSTILAAYPEHAGARFSLLMMGWDSVAVDVDDRLIFKFPRHEEAKARLVKEARLLAIVRPAVTMPVPDLVLHEGPPLFSRHTKLKGEHLVTAQYDRLPEEARRDLATAMARFYAELHRLDQAAIAAAGASPIKPWLTPDEILSGALPVLPADLRPYAERTVETWHNLPPDPYGITYGFFDGHGWNMAFDHERRRLNGIYDFGDSGFGTLHQEFIYSNLVSRDLTARIVDGYEALTGRTLDRGRIELLSGVHRLSELAELAHDPEWVERQVKVVADWSRG